jgi:hypothetical protein
MSANGMAIKDSDATLNAELDQYEIDFMYKFGFFSARADINSLGPVGGVTTEQAFITAALSEHLNLSMGKFLSSSGFEAAEPTGLYQFSTSKTTGDVYGGYQNGLNIAYSTPMFGVYGAVVTDLWNGGETDLLNSPGFEAQFSLMPAEGITAKVTGLFQLYDKDAIGDDGQDLINVWASYAKGPLTAAAEFNYLLNWNAGVGAAAINDATGMGWLAMVNYKATEKLGVTLRYSALTIDDEAGATDDMGSEVTLSPSYAISPNWLVLAEARMDFGNYEATSYAAESTFSF